MAEQGEREARRAGLLFTLAARREEAKCAYAEAVVLEGTDAVAPKS